MNPPHTHHQTLAADRIPLREKVGISLGYLAFAGTSNTAFGMISFVFNMLLGVSPALLSTIGFVQSIGTSIADPILGQYSDNFRSRWGRRRPLMAIAAVPMVALLVALYHFPRGVSEHVLVLWLAVTLPLLSMTLSLYYAPLGALAIEATTDYHERIRLGTLVTVVMLVFCMSKEWIFPLIQLPIFADPLQGLHIVIGGMGLILVIAAFAPVLLCREKNYATLTKKLPKGALFPNLIEATKNRPFLIVLSIKFFTLFCYNVVSILGMYMNTYYVYGGDVKKAAVTYAVLGSSYAVAAVVSFFVYPHLARRLGKKCALQIAAGILVFGCLCKLCVYNPRYPWLQLIVLMANGAAVQGMNLVITTMLGDIIDYDEMISGARREALYGSLIAFFEKVGGNCGALLSGFMLVWIGFNVKTGAQPEHTLQLMKYFYFLFPFIGALFAIFAIRRYDISEDRAYEIRDELIRRHAADDALPTKSSTGI